MARNGRLFDISAGAALCCPVFGLLLAELFHFVPWPAGEFGVAFESMGHMLMLIAAAAFAVDPYTFLSAILSRSRCMRELSQIWF